MENVLTAFITLFLILFLVLTISGVFAQTQDMLMQSWVAMEQHIDTQTRTHLVAVEAYTSAAGSQIDAIWRNTGSTRLVDFDQWDVILQYYDAAIPPALHIGRLEYTSGIPASDQWGIEGIYLSTSQDQPETFEPTILNPGEELWSVITVSPPVGAGQAVQLILSTESGAGAAVNLLGNFPPAETINTNLIMAQGSTAIITSQHLIISDQDDSADELVYTVTSAPQQGELTPATAFTQADIDAGRVSYTHAGSTGSDSFAFSVSDGKDTLEPLTFTIEISARPQLAVNTGLTISGPGTWTIPAAQLALSDVDDQAGDLRYTITVPPLYGSLSLGSNFTQADIDQGLLTYTSAAVLLPDQFQFTATDGDSIIGPYFFVLTTP